ncbi:MAG: DMT family transporter [Hyphomicrobiales bacterium]
MSIQPGFLDALRERLRTYGQLIEQWWLKKPGNVRGALWIFIAALFFSISVAFIKEVGQRLHVTQILFVRQSVMFLTVLPVLVSGFPAILKTDHFPIHMARVSLALIAMLAGFSAVIHIPLAEATAISFAKSFFVTIFAIWFLKEKVGVRRWTATAVGFIGVLIMVRPTGDGLDIWAAAAVLGAAAAGLVMIILRYLSRFEKPVTILSYQVIFVGILMLAPALYFWKAPTLHEWVLLLLIGITSFFGQLLNIRAFRVGEATAIASLDYTRLIYATLLGVILFNEWPTAETLLGASIIIGASLYTVWREAQLGRKLARSAEGRGYNN